MNQTLDPSQIPLRDIHLPDAIAWWPPAFGWWILGAIVVAGAAVVVARYLAGWRHRMASRALEQAMKRLREGEDPVVCAQSVSMILRRFVMTIHDDPALVAGLSGEQWLEFLDSRWEQSAFASGEGRGILTAPYVATGRLKREQCLELGLLCAAWVKAQPVRN